MERETFHVEHIRAFQSDIYGQQVFHVEHKTNFAQKSEPLTGMCIAFEMRIALCCEWLWNLPNN